MTRKCLYLLGLWLTLCTFTSCQKHKSTMELTDFTKEAISVFASKPAAWGNVEEIMLFVNSDSTHYYLTMVDRETDESWDVAFSDSVIIMGQTTFQGHKIYQIGTESNLLFTSAVKPYKIITWKNDIFWEYDPYQLVIPIFKETLMFDEKYFLQQWSEPSQQTANTIQLLCEKYITPKQTTL